MSDMHYNGEFVFSLSYTGASAASTTTGGTPITDLARFETLQILATLTGATGGVSNVYVQISHDYMVNLDTATWWDYGHFAQMADGAAAASYVINLARNAPTMQIATIGSGTTASPGVLLDAGGSGAWIGGPWGHAMRIVEVTGSGVSAGAAQVIKVTGTMPLSRIA